MIVSNRGVGADDHIRPRAEVVFGPYRVVQNGSVNRNLRIRFLPAIGELSPHKRRTSKETSLEAKSSCLPAQAKASKAIIATKPSIRALNSTQQTTFFIL